MTEGSLTPLQLETHLAPNLLEVSVEKDFGALTGLAQSHRRSNRWLQRLSFVNLLPVGYENVHRVGLFMFNLPPIQKFLARGTELLNRGATEKVTVQPVMRVGLGLILIP